VLDFQLFRIRVLPLAQGDFFQAELARSEILRRVVESLPSAEFRAGLTWHLGNLAAIDESGLYFRLGRISSSMVEIYDEEEGSFIDEEFETAPYTHVILDVELGVCAIAKKTRLSPTTKGIAQQFIRLLSESAKATELRVTLEIDDLNDPEDFIIQLKEAYSISKFWISFSRPNAFDADEDFVKPFQKMVEASNSEKGKAELKGQNLDSVALEALARSAAATGDDASAWLKRNQRSRLTRKQLKGNPVNVSQESVADENQQKTLLDRVRELYQKIRGNGNA